ncbi:uncharacterized protein TNCV_607331 [Trichonephila clavipes]|nr:uncharacterized protein TNCV_607331 [Trichonephila clavipes]
MFFVYLSSPCYLLSTLRICRSNLATPCKNLNVYFRFYPKGTELSNVLNKAKGSSRKIATSEQKAFVFQYAKTESTIAVQQLLCIKCKPPNDNNISRYYLQFETTGCICKGKSTGRLRISEESVALVRDYFLRSPRESVRRASRVLSIPATPVWKVLRKRLELRPYHLQFEQALKPTDNGLRAKFPNDMLMHVHEHFMDYVVFNGAPPHWHLSEHDWLNITVPNQWIGRKGPHDNVCFAWLLRSPDLKPCDLHLWQFIKNTVYVPSLPDDLPDLRHRIEAAVARITSDTVNKVWDELAYRLAVGHVTNATHIDQF